MNKFFKMSLLIFVLASTLQICICNMMSAKTKELNQISLKIAIAQSEISVMKQQVYLSSSISNLEQKAKEQGFLEHRLAIKSINKPVVARAF